MSDLDKMMLFWEAVVSNNMQMYVKSNDGTTTTPVDFNPFALCDCTSIVSRLFPAVNATAAITSICSNDALFGNQNPFQYPHNPLHNPLVITPAFPNNSLVIVEFKVPSPALGNESVANGEIATWGSSGKSSIVVRSDYLPFIVRLFSNPDHKYAKLLGPSGIGKSILGFFLIAFIRRIIELVRVDNPDCRAVNVLDDRHFLYRHPEEADKPSVSLLLYVKANVGVCEIVNVATKIVERSSRPYMVIADSCVEDTWCSGIHLFIGSATNSAVHKVTRKWLQIPSKNKFSDSITPVTTLDHELVCGIFAGGVCTNRNDLQFLRDVFGSSLRYMEFAMGVNEDFDEEYDQIIYKRVLQHMNDFFDGHLLDGQELLMMKASRVIAISLSTLTQTTNIDTNILKASGLFMQTHRLVRPDGNISNFASACLRHIAFEIHNANEVDLRAALTKVVGSSGFGCAFEHVSHGILQKSVELGGIEVQSTDSNITAKTTIPTTLVKLTKHFIRTWEDITTMPDNTYGYPLVSKFPLIDSVVKLAGQPPIVFQVTVSDTHASKALDRQLELYNILDPPRVEPVVPIDTPVASTPGIKTRKRKSGADAAAAAAAALVSSDGRSKVRFVYVLTNANYKSFRPEDLDPNFWLVCKTSTDTADAQSSFW